MGQFALDRTPGHAVVLQDRYALFLEGMAGVEQGWNMAAATWSAPNGFDTDNAEGDLPNHLLSSRIEGGRVTGRRDRGREHRDTMDKGTISLVPQRLPVHYWCTGPVRFMHLYFTDAFVRALGTDVFGDAADRPGLLRDNELFTEDAGLRNRMREYVDRAFSVEEPPTRLEMDARAALIGLHLVRRHSLLSSTRQKPQVRGGLASWQVRRVQEYLSAHLPDDVGLGELAALVHLSPAYFCRAYKQATGRSPIQQLTALRIERAKHLLSDPYLPITEVAAACGYGSPSAFSKVFRRETDVTPSTWRREQL